MSEIKNLFMTNTSTLVQRSGIYASFNELCDRLQGLGKGEVGIGGGEIEEGSVE